MALPEMRISSPDDLCAMKMNAILGRGEKKDFFDLFELTRHFSLEKIFDLYQQKYPNQLLAVSLPQALIYFTDAEESEDPQSLNGTTWEEVKEGLRSAVREYLS